MARDPYCRNCKYSLTGLTESSKCPECGMPLVEVLERGSPSFMGKRYRSELRLFGLPLIDIATGPHGDEPRGTARGIIAIGDVATGWFAMGGLARGVIACGGFAFGLVAFGGIAVGLLSFAGVALGVLGAYGGAALGGVAGGGVAIGGIVPGGAAAVGYYVAGGAAVGKHVISSTRRDVEATEFFQNNRWLIGGYGFKLPLLMAISTFLLAVLLFLVGLLAYLLRRPAVPSPDG